MGDKATRALCKAGAEVRSIELLFPYPTDFEVRDELGVFPFVEAEKFGAKISSHVTGVMRTDIQVEALGSVLTLCSLVGEDIVGSCVRLDLGFAWVEIDSCAK